MIATDAALAYLLGGRVSIRKTYLPDDGPQRARIVRAVVVVDATTTHIVTLGPLLGWSCTCGARENHRVCPEIVAVQMVTGHSGGATVALPPEPITPRDVQAAEFAVVRSLVVLADKVADRQATEERCFEVGARSRGIEQQVAADALRSGMLAVLADYLEANQMESAVVGRVDHLIREAVAKRGGR